MRFPQLTKGTLLRRYKRFLADVELEDGTTVTAHCANSGSMLDVGVPGLPVLLSYHDDSKRKLKWSWELIHLGDSWVGVNTSRPNQLVEEAILKGRIAELQGYESLRREVKYSTNSRIDILLEDPDKPPCYVEVKNSTLAADAAEGDPAHGERLALFPDSVTTRGQKHLRDLMQEVARGHRAVLVFWVFRQDCTRFRPADTIDPEYGRLLREADTAGVELLAYDANVDRKGVTARNRVPIELTWT